MTSDSFDQVRVHRAVDRFAVRRQLAGRSHAWRNTTCCVLFACTAVYGWPAAAAGLSAPPAVSITSTGHIRVLAHENRVSDVIERLKFVMGNELDIYDSVPNSQTLSADCSSPDLIELIPCVFGRDTSYIVQTSQNTDSARSTRVWILPRGAIPPAASSKHADTPTPVTAVAHPNSAHPNNRTLGNRQNQDSTPLIGSPIAGGPSSKQPVEQQASSQDPTLEPLTDADIDQLAAMARAGDAEQRAQALTRLTAGGAGNHAAVRQALEAGLADDDPAVRAQAVSGLALRDGVAAYPVLQRAIVDYDISVRLVAVDSVPRNSLGHALLEAALTDTDASVRSLAANKMQEWGYRP